MNIFILDDNIDTAINLSGIINKHFPEYKINTYDNIKSFEFDIQNVKECIVFLDILMPKTSGISIAKKINFTKPYIPIVLYSGFPQNRYDVYDCQHIYFLEKPFEEQKIIKAINYSIAAIENNLFTFNFSKRTFSIPYSSIVYFESSAKMINIVSIDGTYHFYDKIDNIIKNINYPFIRISKSFLVNPNFIIKIEDNDIYLKNTINENCLKKVQISRRYKKQVLENELLYLHFKYVNFNS